MRKIITAVAFALPCIVMSKGLESDQRALSPMEARLERASGNKVAEPKRVQNAQKAPEKLQREVPNATVATSGSKVTYQQVTKPCCKSKQTVTTSCGCAKVGIGSTKGAAAAAAQSSKACGKATW